jgi:hypothetical protein
MPCKYDILAWGLAGNKISMFRYWGLFLLPVPLPTLAAVRLFIDQFHGSVNEILAFYRVVFSSGL